MMHKTWSSIEEVPYCFWMSSVKFQGHMGQKKHRFRPQIGGFRAVTLVWIHWWLWNDAQHRSGALLFFKVTRQISRWHGTKNCRFWPELGVSGLSLQFEFTHGFEMMHKAWYSIKEVPHCFPRSSVKFQGHTRQKTSILTQIGCFRTVTLVWIHWLLWNDVNSIPLTLSYDII